MKNVFTKTIALMLAIISIFSTCAVLAPVSALSNNVHDILFDWEYYYAANSDVAKAFGRDPAKLRWHYDNYGKNEGRAPSKLFNPKEYLALYSDLKNHFRNDYKGAYNHFVSYGINESRQASSKFSVSIYKANYEDLRKAFGNNNLLYLKHYREYGEREGRNAVKKISTTSNNRANGNTTVLSPKPIIENGYYAVGSGNYVWNVQFAPTTGIGNFCLDPLDYQAHEVFYIQYVASKNAYYITPIYRQGEAAANALYGKDCSVGSQMKLHPSNTSDTASLWHITASNQGFKFQNVASGLYVTMNSSAKTGTKLLLMRSQNTRQGFNITKISDSKVKEIKNQSAGLLSPIKGGLTVTGSSATTNGYKCDYKANGTPIYAPCDGTVYLKQTTAGGTLVSYGNWVDFRSSEGGYRIKMAHLSSLVGIESKKTSIASRRLSSSQVSGVTTATLLTKQVKKGELIGYSGESGNAWGPHLHIEVTKDGKALNPQTAFVSW